MLVAAAVPEEADAIADVDAIHRHTERAVPEASAGTEEAVAFSASPSPDAE